MTERATKMAMQNATVVKNPKEFWSLTSAECMFEGGVREQGNWRWLLPKIRCEIENTYVVSRVGRPRSDLVTYVIMCLTP